MNIAVLIKSPDPAWYNYAVVVVLVPIGLFVFYKIFVRYKIIRMGNSQIQIDFPVLRQRKIYPLDQVETWRENKVKTGKNSEYKELEVLFKDRNKFSTGHREHTEYSRMIQYMTQKVPKKRTSGQ